MSMGLYMRCSLRLQMKPGGAIPDEVERRKDQFRRSCPCPEYMTPQALSYHLAKLKKADLIYETRYKNFIYYELNLSILDETIMWITKTAGRTGE